MRVLLTIALAISAVFTLSAPARAGTYDVWGCRLPSGYAAPVAGWQPEGAASNLCSGATSGMAAGLSASQMPAGSFAGWMFGAPEGLTIRNYTLYRSARVSHSTGSSLVYGLYHDVPVFKPGVNTFETCIPYWQQCTQIGDPAAAYPLDPDNAVSRSGLSIRRIILRISCGGPGETAPCVPSAPGGSFVIGRSRIGLADDAAPMLGTPVGAPARDGAFLEGPQAIEVPATDAGGGVSRLLALVDGAPAGAIATNSVKTTCELPYVAVVPCPQSVRLAVPFATSSIPNGRHTLQVAAEDAAGNRTVSGGWTVVIANGAVANGNRASRVARLRASFEARGAKRRPKETSRAFGEPARVSGKLVDGSGQPIGAARIDIVARPNRAGAGWRKEGEVVTRPDGSFRRLLRSGPSRELRLQYRAFSLDPTPTSTAALRMNVRAGVRLTVRPRRTTSRGSIRFLGRLLGRSDRAGLQVTLYAVDRAGRRRVPVEVVRTDSRGRFRFRYRFARTFAPFTYRFIAKYERQATFPYAAGTSPVAKVRVVK